MPAQPTSRSSLRAASNLLGSKPFTYTYSSACNMRAQVVSSPAPRAEPMPRGAPIQCVKP
eukprot:scaffold15157_cov27-Tisochrysis_lutea.AAC.2